MPYDPVLADRLRDLLVDEPGVVEKKMFGGLAFLINGHMAVVASREGGLMLRVEPEQTAALLTEPGVGPFVMRGKALQGWLRVEASAVADDERLGPWVERGASYASSLPPD